MLYRKRDEARGVRELGMIARFRYNDLKEAAVIAAGAGPMQIGVEGWRAGALGWCDGAQQPTRCVEKSATARKYC